MSNFCPKPCSRLVTAAIFMILGVVQLLAGAILMRSEQADLLSGPNFMTGTSNIAIGCVYGVISSIWKISSKKKSVKISARKNILASLLVSVITVNATAAIILIMGEGNRLLDLHLEKSKYKTSDFASEILAYAFISAISSPIFCVVVALVSLTGRLIEVCQDISNKKAKNSIANDEMYSWVFDPKTNSNVKVICDTVGPPSESSSSSEDSVFVEENCSYSRPKSIMNIPSPVNMFEEKRGRTMKEVNWKHSKSRLDLAIEKPDFCAFSHEKLIPRVKETSLRKDANQKSGTNSYRTFKSILRKSFSSPVSRGERFHADNPCNCVFDTRNRCDRAQKVDKENQENRIFGHLRARKGVTSLNKNKPSEFSKMNGRSLNQVEVLPHEEIHFLDPILSELKAETLKELKQKVAKILPGASIAVIKLASDYGNPYYVSNSEYSDEAFTNNGNLRETAYCSDVSRYKLFTNCSESSTSAGKQLLSDESVHPSISSSRNSSSTPGAYKNKGKKTGLSTISRIRSKSYDYGNEEAQTQSGKENKYSSFNTRVDHENFSFDSQRISSKQSSRKLDSSRKLSMASIAEIPSEEEYFSDRNSACSISDFGDSSRLKDENFNIKDTMPPSSKQICRMKTSRRKSSLTSNKLFKKLSSSEPRINVLDLIVDKDSLIGLSEEELVARTFRMRSLRKTVEDRLKKKKEAEKQIATNNYSSAT